MCTNFVNSYLKKQKNTFFLLTHLAPPLLWVYKHRHYLSSIYIMLYGTIQNWCFKLGIKYDIKSLSVGFLCSYIAPKPKCIYKQVSRIFFWFLPKSSTNIHECILHISLPKTRDIRTYSVLRSCKQEMQTSLMNVSIFKLLSLFCVFFACNLLWWNVRAHC